MREDKERDQDHPWPDNPYKGLSYYTSGDVGLFAGRTSEVRACARIIADDSTKVLLLHGPTGCGKSSFIRAGLIPFLESEVRRFQFLRTFDANNLSALFVRCTDAPLERLSEILFDWGSGPLRIQTPDSEPLEIPIAEILGTTKERRAFIDDNSTSVSSLISTLRRASELLPRTTVLIFDQGEEVFTLSAEQSRQRKLFFDFLTEFSSTPMAFSIIVALRKEYFADFSTELGDRKFSAASVKYFALREMTREQLVAAIKVPTRDSVAKKYLQGRQQPRDYYNVAFEEGLPEVIADSLILANTEGGVLPVLQITCERLYAKADQRRQGSVSLGSTGNFPAGGKPRALITFADYESLGELDEQVNYYVHGIISREVERQFPGFAAPDKQEEIARWKDVLHSMVQLQSDNTAVTRICSAEQLERTAATKGCRANFEEMTAVLAQADHRVLREDSRLIDQGKGQAILVGLFTLSDKSVPTSSSDAAPNRYFSLGHDAIAVALSKWQATRKLDLEQRSLTSQVRSVRRLSTGNIIVAVVSLAVSIIAGWNINEGLLSFSYSFELYYVLLTAVGLGVAGSSVALIRTIEILNSDKFAWIVRFGGPICAAVVVFLAGYLFIHNSTRDFDLTIRLQGNDSPLAEIAKQSRLAVDLDVTSQPKDSRLLLELSPLAVAKVSLPFRYRGKAVSINFESPSFRLVNPKVSYPIPPDGLIRLDVEKKPARQLNATTVGQLYRITSGGTSDGKSPFCQTRTVEGCITPQHTDGHFVPGTASAVDVTQVGRTSWKVTKDDPSKVCIEFLAATGACETEVSIQGRPSAVEQYPAQ